MRWILQSYKRLQYVLLRWFSLVGHLVRLDGDAAGAPGAADRFTLIELTFEEQTTDIF